MKKRAVIYAREEQETPAGKVRMKKQIDTLTEYCKRNKIDIAGIYSEYGYANTVLLRPEFMKMIRYVEENSESVDFVLFDRPKTYSTSPSDTLETLLFLIRKKIEPIAVLEPHRFKKWLEVFLGLIEANKRKAFVYTFCVSAKDWENEEQLKIIDQFCILAQNEPDRNVLESFLKIQELEGNIEYKISESGGSSGNDKRTVGIGYLRSGNKEYKIIEIKEPYKKEQL